MRWPGRNMIDDAKILLISSFTWSKWDSIIYVTLKLAMTRYTRIDEAVSKKHYQTVIHLELTKV